MRPKPTTEVRFKPDGTYEVVENTVMIDDTKIDPVPKERVSERLKDWRETVAKSEIEEADLRKQPPEVKKLYALVKYLQLEIDTLRGVDRQEPLSPTER